MSTSAPLRVAVLGVGMMGTDHVHRLRTAISGAQVTVVADAFADKAAALADSLDGVRAVESPLDAVAADDVDAVVVASPGSTHEELVLACLDRQVPVLCEKPLTTDPASSLRIVQAEAKLGRTLVQVGFMRRFDPEYAALKALLDAGELGAPLLLHHAHRNLSVPDSFTSDLLMKDSVVHEVDITRFLLGEEITAVTVKRPRSTTKGRDDLVDPQFVLLETESGVIADVEIFVSNQVGYEVRCEAVGELGTAMMGLDVGIVTRKAQRWGGAIPTDFRFRFGAAYDIEVQRWVDAARRGTIDGPGAWDGYAAIAVCEAGVRSLESGERVEVEMVAESDVLAA